MKYIKLTLLFIPCILYAGGNMGRYGWKDYNIRYSPIDSTWDVIEATVIEVDTIREYTVGHGVVFDDSVTFNNDVVLTLGARYLKRIALHLSNIASSIFLPMPEMDYIKDGIKKKNDKWSITYYLY